MQAELCRSFAVRAISSNDKKHVCGCSGDTPRLLFPFWSDSGAPNDRYSAAP